MSAATFSTSIEAQQAAALIEGYRFELGSHDARQWVSLWLESYRPVWIRDAVIEALYQGRYKSVSVRQILELWNRRGQPIRHVTHEFEAAVCREFGDVKLAATQLPKGRSRSARSSSIRKARAPQSEPSSAAIQNVTKKVGQADFGPTAAVSFDLSATLPGMAPIADANLASNNPASNLDINQTPERTHKTTDKASAALTPAPEQQPEQQPKQQPEQRPQMSNNNSPEPYHPVSRSAIQSPAETEALLRTQKQLNGVLYTSARAIQPFKPALPFSAQTLRLARQKAMA